MRGRVAQRQVRDFCPKCRAMRIGVVDFEAGQYATEYPARCSQKDTCEAEILRLLQIEPHRHETGEIVRGPGREPHNAHIVDWLRWRDTGPREFVVAR